MKQENRNALLASVKKLSNEMDSIFYFVSYEGLQLKKDMQNKVAQKVGDYLGYKLYGMRSGPDVQEPKLLYEELSEINEESFEIISFSKEFDEFSVLGHEQKLIFKEECKTAQSNTGFIAKNLLKE
jgi:hypothetical protein